MKKLIIILAMAAASAHAGGFDFIGGMNALGGLDQANGGSAPQRMARWTGHANYSVELVGGGYGTNCQYDYHGDTFWRAFRDNRCPAQVPV